MKDSFYPAKEEAIFKWVYKVIAAGWFVRYKQRWPAWVRYMVCMDST
ncbi:MAG: hypothetical protein ABIY51_02155 [Ferruginibacter sp.]